ncbi:MAG: cation transporter, partial [Pseudaminobacter sp.]
MQPTTAADAVPDGLDLESLRPAGRMIFSVRGMFCASCAMAVERVIEKIPGVLASNVNFTSGAALVRWEPDGFDFKNLFDRVNGLGYELSPLLDSNELNRSLQAQASRIRLQLIIAAFFGMWSMLGSWMLYFGIEAVAGIDALLVGWTATAFSLPVILYSGLDLYRAGWKTVLAGVPGMDALVSLGVWGSLLLSLWSLSRGSPAVYVDAATMLVTFLLVGRPIEIQARKHNLVAIDALRQLLPETARLVQPDGKKQLVPLASVQVGASVYVQAGER